ncbi:MAG: undecaprenyldiphospho-muramoylpentapeptide beta-N-acetylglucosaminyltransferase [Thermodesulfobacteriota bacterium]
MENAQPPYDPHGLPIRLVIAGAGTGGHLFPGIAVAETVMEQMPGARVLFVTTGRAIETTVLGQKEFETAVIPAAGLKGMGLWHKLRSLGILPRGLVTAIRILRRFAPDVVMGMGGYSSGPVMVGAKLLGIRRVIHEQNRWPGLTNRLLARMADRIYVSFADTPIGAAGEKVRFTGNPVRTEIAECGRARQNAPDAEKKQRLSVLILGGSQGAHRINEAVIEAVDHLDNVSDFCFIHQTGTADAQPVRAAYGQKGAAAQVSAFFDDMAECYRVADIAVCRAGATTVAELAAACVPAIFIPFPHAADNHQVANAEGMVAAGAAEMVSEDRLDGPFLAGRLARFAGARHELARMQKAIESHAAAVDAASVIAEDLCALAGKNFRRDADKTIGQ